MKLIFLYAFVPICLTILSYPQEMFNISKGSAVIGIARNDTIWIGADSKITDTGILGSATSRCKIIRSGNIIFAHHGVIKDYFTNVDIDTIIVHSIEGGTDVRSIIEYFNQAMIFTLQYISTLEVIGKKYSIGDTLNNYHTGFLIAAVEREQPILYSLEYDTKVNDTVPRQSFLTKTELIQQHYNAEIGKIRYFAQGVGNIDEEIRAYQNRNIPSVIVELIERAIQKFPDHLGGPISIIQITKDDIKWIQKGLCE